MSLGQWTFLWPWVFAALPLPLLVRYWLPRAQPGAGQVLRVPFFAAISAAVGVQGAPAARLALVSAVLAWVLLVTAAARPQLLGEPIALPLQGRDLMLAVDISESMSEEDMVIPAGLLPSGGTSAAPWGAGKRAVDRLTAVKAVAGDFIERRAGDRVGLILFGTQAYLQAPLTFDRRTVRTLLFDSEVGLAGKATAIGDAIGLALKRLRHPTSGTEAARDAVLVLLTDGVNTAGSIEPRKAAELAAREGVRIYTIAIGSAPRAAFGLALGGADVDEPTLQAIAQTTGGRFFRARDVKGLQAIYAALDELEPAASAEQTYRPVQDLFQWPLGTALLLSVLTVAGRLAGGLGWASAGRRGPPDERDAVTSRVPYSTPASALAGAGKRRPRRRTALLRH